MPSKEFHLNKIKELEFQRDIKVNQDNRLHATVVALLSVVTVFLILEVQTEKRVNAIILLSILLFVLLFAMNRKVHYPENEKIQRNFDALLGRKK